MLIFISVLFATNPHNAFAETNSYNEIDVPSIGVASGAFREALRLGMMFL